MSDTKDLEELDARRTALRDELRNELVSDVIREALNEALNSLDRKANSIREEIENEERLKREYEAYDSPLGKLVTAVFDAVHYDYADASDYPGIIEQIHHDLAHDKLQVKVVPLNEQGS